MDPTRDRSDRKAVVIGGGMGGMAAALQLRARGHAVVLVEKNARLGGIAAGFERNGVRGFYPLGFCDFPAFESLFAMHGKRVRDYTDIIHQDRMYTRFIYDDGRSLDLGDLAFSLASLETRGTAQASQYRRLYEFSEQLLRNPVHSAATFAQIVAQHVDDEALRMAICYRTSLLGENPYSTSSFYVAILQMQETWGSFTAPGGVAGLVAPLERLMKDVGIEVIAGDAVTRLECEGRFVRTAVLQSGREFPCSHVISDIAPLDLYGSLLPAGCGEAQRASLREAKYSPSVFSYHFTTSRCRPDLPSTLVIFPRDLEKFCSQVYDEGVLPDELLLGVYRGGFFDGSLAPTGTEHFSVYLSVPNLQHDVDWPAVSEGLREDIVARLEEYLLPGLSQDLLDGFHRTPLDLESECGLPYGAGFGRQATRADLGKELLPGEDPEVTNLYLVGHHAFPGPGLNAVLMSAQFAVARVPAPA